MTSSTSIDLNQLETHLSSVKAQFEGHFASWLSRRLFVNVILAYLVLVMVPLTLAGDPGRVLHLSGPTLWLNLVGPFVFAGFMTIWSAWFTRRQVRGGPQEMARRIEQEVENLTGPGWIRRVLRVGLLMALAIGLPIGGLIAVFVPAGAFPGGSRLLTVPAVFAMTLLWTVPMAFVLRWATLRLHRRWIQPL